MCDNGIVDQLIMRARAAQAQVAGYTQEQIDDVCLSVGWEVYKDENIAACARVAVDETGMGVYEDKLKKHKVKVMGVCKDVMGAKSVGLVERDEAKRLSKYAKPVGVVGALTPVTNPTATPASNAVSILKGRNAVIFAPHPKAKEPCRVVCEFMRAGLKKVGAPEAKEKAKELFAKKIKKILVERALDVAEELYVSVTIDARRAKAVIMASRSGGVDIEDIAATSPEKIHHEYIDVVRGVMPFQIKNVLFGLGLKGDVFKQGYKIIDGLFKLFRERDAELVEINPLVLTSDGELVAADGKVILDDNAGFRQGKYSVTAEHFDSEIEFEAAQKGFPYIQFDGDIGLMCAGAGLTNTVYDLINYYGGTVANYLEFGGPNYRRAVEAMELALKGEPKVLLMVTFGTIARADVMAEGIVEAVEKLKPKIPIVTAIRGTGEEKARKILQAACLEILSETEDAVVRAVEIAKGGSR